MSRMYRRILLFTEWSGIGVQSFRGARCLHHCVSTLMTEPARTYHTLLVATQKTKIRLCMSVSHSVFRLTFLGYVMFSRTPSWEHPVSHIVHQNSWGHIRNCKNRYDCPSHASIWFTLYRSYKTGNVRFNLTLRRLRGTIVSVQKQEVVYILCVCVCLCLSVCILSDPACKAHAPYFIVLSVLFDCTTFSTYLINNTIIGIKLLGIKSVFL
jgi:hypothetical protein